MGALSSDTPCRLVFWFYIFVTFIVILNLSSHGISAESKDDSDLVFESLEQTNSKNNENHRRISRTLSEDKNEESLSSPPAEESWVSNTVGRIKRSINEFLGQTENEEVTSKPKELPKRQIDWGGIFGQTSDNQDEEQGQGQLEETDFDDPFDSTNNIDNNSTELIVGEFGLEEGDDEDFGNSGFPSGEHKNPIDQHPVYFRITCTVLEPYYPEYSDRNSQKFRTFATDFVYAIERLYDNTPGSQSAHVIRIQKREADVFTSKVTLDLGSEGYGDSEKIREVLFNHIQSHQRIGSHSVSTEDFQFRAFDDIHPSHQCESNEITCTNGDCVPSAARCNGVFECYDRSDEDGCYKPKPHDGIIRRFPSRETETAAPDFGSGDGIDHDCRADDVVRCTDGSRIICADQKCDGRPDCDDGGDERNCNDCAVNEFVCDISRCLPLNKRCNGVTDCEDGTDETDCPSCPEYTCDGTVCYSASQRCDGVPNCNDRSDESNCPSAGAQCGPGRFSCGDGECIWDYQRCNNVQDCRNNRDEYNCTTETCRIDEVLCSEGICGKKCDSIFDCIDGSDERNCQYCTPSEFSCASGGCIDETLRCDNITHCDDGSDELDCACASDQFDCGNVQCIQSTFRCDGVRDCPDGRDEENCPAQCRDDQFECDDGTCIEGSQQCDGRPDCRDRSDEAACPSPVRCSEREFRCLSDNTCIPNPYVCNGKPECRDGSDEANCPCVNKFQCLNGQCIENNLQCNGWNDCSDGSDEYNCPTQPPVSPTEIPVTFPPSRSCPRGMQPCQNGDQCISPSQVCDGRIDCNDRSDESFCTGSGSCHVGEFRCENGPCIDEILLCDGKVDCPYDTSDELDCVPRPTYDPNRPGRPGEGLDLKTYPSSQEINENIYKPDREVVFQCRDEGSQRARVRWTRPNGAPLPPGSRDINGRLEMPDIKVEHSGIYICEAVGVYPGTPGSQVQVSLKVDPWVPLPTRPATACALTEATCSNGDCIPKSLVCNGQYDCTDGSDESRCNPHGCEPNQFRCANKKCVLKTWVCDSDNDCGDGSDESNCARSPPGSLCQYHQFTCRSNNQCIPKSFHCDSQRDCVDGSDEIGCSQPIIQKPPPPMANLVVGETLTLTCTAVGVPTPEIVWRLNWGHIPPKCTTSSENGFGTLTCPNMQIEDQGAYSCEAINIKISIFAIPDTIVVVTGPNTTVCPSGYFNDEARTQSECIKCFCFGQTTQCRSADLFVYQFQPPFDTLRILGARIDPSSGAVEVRDEPIYRGVQPQLTAIGRNGVHAQVLYGELSQPNVVPYFTMPENYHGNQLKSYGGYLKYSILHNNRGYPVGGPDVVLTGNGYTLVHQSRYNPQPGRPEQISVRFFEGEWMRRSSNAPEVPASREDIMMVLDRVDNILIKLQYNEGSLNTSLTDIEMDSAGAANSGLGPASYVEECQCPAGYRGSSCEDCADGYERHKSGPWLGKCFPVTRPCPPGTYGDPQRGISCQTCPCPLTNPSNQFARTCHLSPDGSVICDCPTGYVGNRCEQCAPGYSGNPMVPGDSCRPISPDPQPGRCNAPGSLSQNPDEYGRCRCKDYVEGPYCDQCKSNTYYLSSSNQFGCIACFCMGVTRQCSSSNWYRDEITSVFTSSRNEFTLVDSLNREVSIEEGIRLDQQSREIVYSSFPTSNVYYWSLPPRYLGNKITSYGGNLRYTLKYVPLPGGQSSRNSAADVELVSNNQISLLYFAKEQAQHTGSAQTFVVPLFEQYWQRSDGQKADREHLLMALADLSAIYIKATYTTNTRQAALVSVTLDTSSERNTGSSLRALEVEQCQCPQGYKGLSCEDCDFGYTRSDEGIYLGLCEPCNCNGHSNDCNPESGSCYNCRDHTEGENCERCLPGYVGDPVNNVPCSFGGGGGSLTCNCDYGGSVSSECYNGVCRCKTNVEGNNCDRCRPGTFGLNASLSEGCQACFCSGVSSDCSESNLYIQQIPSQIIDETHHGFSLADQYGEHHINSGFSFNISKNEIGYAFKPSSSERWYWSLPNIFTGNKITSYGGQLEYTQRYTQRPQAGYIPDQDVIITGNKVTIYWTNPYPQQPDVPNKISVALSPQNKWQRLIQGQGPRPASREDILTALANVESILVRAQLSSDTFTSYISDITLDTALEQYTRQPKAKNVEVCKCPLGYRGTSCESCASGFYRDVFDIRTGPLGSCTRCPCNGNEQSCNLNADNRVECQCLPGYSGPRCEYKFNDTTPNPLPIPTIPPPTIEIIMITPKLVLKEIGSSVTFNCSARSLRYPKEPITIRWMRDGAELPRNAIDYGTGILVITNLRVSDSGRYICEAYDTFNVVTQDVALNVGDTNPPEYPRVEVYPPYVEVNERQPIEFSCRGIAGNPDLRIVRADGQPMNRDYTFLNGVFRIPISSKFDEGQYDCIGTNSQGATSERIEIVVHEFQSPIIRPRVDPTRYNGNAGETFTLRCEAPGFGHTIRWSKLNGPLPYTSRENNGVLTVYDARPEDAGTYVCTVTSIRGESGTASSVVTISSSAGSYPTVTISQEKLTIAEGASAELECVATGIPPPTIKWTKSTSEFGPNVFQRGSRLYIRNAQMSDRGVYVCVASNSQGLAQASAFVEISRLEVPVVSILPLATQTVVAGNNAVIQCRVDAGIPTPLVKWSTRDGIALPRNIEQLAGGTLRFNRITVSEAGEYVCTGTNEAGTATAIANIVVHTKPEVWTVPAEDLIMKNRGEYLRLECHASGKPLPTVEWSKAGRPIVPYSAGPRGLSGVHREDQSLRNVAIQQFQHLSTQDEGIYICRGSNDAGMAEKRIRLLIDSLPTRGDIIGEDATSNNIPWKENEPHNRPQYPGPQSPRFENFTAPVGSRAELHCRINSNYIGTDEIFVNWMPANNGSLPENAYVDNGVLYFDNVQPSASGEYNCFGRHGGNTIFILTARLQILSPPRVTLFPQRQVVRPGDNAYIQCTVTGEQPITISWHPINRTLPPSVIIQNGYIQFNNIQLSDAGRYRCMAVNNAGEADAVADVIVDEGIRDPLVTAENRVQAAPEGSSVTLRCIAHNSVRNNNMRWFREHLPLPPNSRVNGGILELFNIRYEDQGRYFCETSANGQSSSDYVDLQVTSPVHPNENQPTLHIYPPETTHRTGDDLEVTCQSTEPGVITTWSKPSGWLADNVRNVGGTLKIYDLRLENNGIYRCEAIGAQGAYHKDYDLYIVDENNVQDQSPVQVKTAPRGSSVIMECSVDLQQPVQYLWTRQGNSISKYVNVNSRTLQLNEVGSGDAGLYICTATNNERKIEVPTILVVTGIVPYFTQAPNSYIALPTLPESYIQFNFEISFKSENSDGILLYNGNSGNRENGDFISLVLNNGKPEFNFNLGHNVTSIKTNFTVYPGNWHTIKVMRNRRKATIYVDGQGPYVGNAEGKYIGLDLSEPLYLGGVPDHKAISPYVGTSAKFVGCISRLKIGYAYTDIMNNAIAKEGVTNCETCSNNRCQNQGVCQESLSAEGYACICPQGFSGPTCSKLKGEACTPYACGKGRCVDTENSFQCLCPLGYVGRRCEREITINEPAFQHDAYVAYPTPKPLRRLKVSMKIKPTNVNDGILLYSGEDEEGHGDFASLAIRDRHVEFRFDAGSGPTVIRSNRELKPNEWVVVTASRSLNEGRLIVSGETPVMGRTPSNHKALNLLTRLYVGGVDKEQIKVNQGVGVFSGFTGCISDITVSGMDLGIISSIEESANVHDCRAVNNADETNDFSNEIVTTPYYTPRQTGCSSNPCRNGGQCYPLSPIEYKCSCANGFSGRDCDIAPSYSNLCDMHPCQNGGTCHGNLTDYQCDCPLGYAGNNCDQRVDLRNGAHFDGNGYLEFNKSYLNNGRYGEDIIALELSTNSSDGLIFWHGQQPNQDGLGQDFISLALVNGFLEFSFDLGSGPAIIHNSDIRVDDGQRHSVILKRHENKGSIEIDNTYFKEGASEGLTTTLNCEGNMYLGGAPNIPLMTGSQYTSGFKGCIHQFELQNSKTLELGSKAISGLNVKPCSRFENINSRFYFNENELVN